MANADPDSGSAAITTSALDADVILSDSGESLTWYPVGLDPVWPGRLSARLSSSLNWKPPQSMYTDTGVALDPALGSGIIFEGLCDKVLFEDLMVNRLGDLQEFRGTVTRTIGVLDAEIECIENITRYPDANFPDGSIGSALYNYWQMGISGQQPTDLDAVLASLQVVLDNRPQFLGDLRSDLWDYLQDALNRTYCVLLDGLFQARNAGRWVRFVITAILHKRLTAIRFFCCHRWERRAWFLRHGSHPAEPSLMAGAGLFARVCSVAPLA